MWASVFSIYPFPLWWLKEYYYHHQIGSINYYLLLTHRGPVTQYCGGSILCKNPIFSLYFSLWRIPPNFRCWNFLKVDIIIFDNPLKNCAFLHLDSSEASLWQKNPKKHLHSIENQSLVNIKLKRDTRLQKKSSRARIILQPWSNFPPFFNFSA